MVSGQWSVSCLDTLRTFRTVPLEPLEPIGQPSRPNERPPETTIRERREAERAHRGVVDRLLAVLIAMLRDGTLYDETRRRRSIAA